MKEGNIGRQIAVKGIVTPADWDEDGSITAVVISTSFEEEYLVENDTLGGELLELIGAEVIVRGTAGPEKKGCRTIAVKEYELLEDEDEEEFEDEGELEEEEEELEEQFEYQGEEW
jgi:hypothetical protein